MSAKRFVFATLLCLMPLVYVCGQERLTSERFDGRGDLLDAYDQRVDNLLNRKGVYVCVVRPSFTNEYSLLVYDDKLTVLTSNTQLWYEKEKPVSLKSITINVDREICTALHGLFDVSIGTRSRYADDRIVFDGVVWVFSDPEGKMASCHSPQTGSDTHQLVNLMETIIKGVKDGDNDLINGQIDVVRRLTESFSSLQPGPDLEYDESIFSVANNDSVKISYIITSAENQTCKVTFQPGASKSRFDQPRYSADSIVIPSTVRHNGTTYTVTRIGERAFSQSAELKSAVIPNTVTWIEDRAFQNCSKLSAIDIPESITGIGAKAFQNCSSLASATIPESVSIIGESAFSGCHKLIIKRIQLRARTRRSTT